MLASTSLLFSYLSTDFLNDSLCWKLTYHATAADKCVMMVMEFLQWVHPTDEALKMNVFGFYFQIRENV